MGTPVVNLVVEKMNVLLVFLCLFLVLEGSIICPKPRRRRQSFFIVKEPGTVSLNLLPTLSASNPISAPTVNSRYASSSDESVKEHVFKTTSISKSQEEESESELECEGKEEVEKEDKDNSKKVPAFIDRFFVPSRCRHRHSSNTQTFLALRNPTIY